MRSESRLLVALSLLEQNYQKLQQVCPNNEVLFMIKAGGYGHGMVPIASFAQELGITEFGCASLGEAIILRKSLKNKNPKEDCKVYVFSENNLHQNFDQEYIDYNLIPVIVSLEDLQYTLSSQVLKNIPLCLKFNTGMNRLGIHHTFLTKVIEKLKKADRKSIDHLMTHYACSAYPMEEHPLNISQTALFKDIKTSLQSSSITLEKTSSAASGSIEQKHGLEHTHIRPGLMLYGPSALMDQHRNKSWWNGNIISTLETSILQHFSVKQDEPLGYHGTPCPRAGIIAVVAIGYGDGFSTRYRGVRVNCNGFVGEVVGAVSMDTAHILFPSDAAVKNGDKVTIWDGDQNRFADISKKSQTIPYELFCNLTDRLPRVYTR